MKNICSKWEEWIKSPVGREAMEVKKFFCKWCKKVISDKTLKPTGSCPYCEHIYVYTLLRYNLEEVDWVSVIKYGTELR